ncbi:MAG TPA: DUF3168 domain-containing protein [Allosphingosinicella sp.]|jgi:hypothetical protein
MSDVGAGEMVTARAVAALKQVSGLAVYDFPPVQAAAPYLVVETGPVSDWGYKEGVGRELRLALTLWDRGERPTRLRDLTRAAQIKVEAIEGEGEGWDLVSLQFLRERSVPPRPPSPNGLAATMVEYRARLLAVQPAGLVLDAL